MTNPQRRPRPAKLAVAIAAAMCACLPSLAQAQTQPAAEASDLQFRFGGSARYNLGIRVEGRNPLLAGDKANQTPAVYAGSLNTDDGDYAVKRGGVAVNRIDLLGELDVSWRRMLSFRMSAAAWRDFAVGDGVRKNPDGGVSSYFNDQLSSTTKRLHQQGGEVLDAYVSYQDAPGGMPVSVKLGRFAELWGEALSLTTHSISYNQAPSDVLKAFASPGADAKETTRPIGQLVVAISPIPELKLSAQQFLEWAPSRLPQGGTFLGPVDFYLEGPDRLGGGSALSGLVNRKVIEVNNRRGEWGLAARWSPAWLEGTLGLYYRNVHERLPTVSLTPATGSFQYIFGENQKLYGISLAKNIGGASMGFEVSMREHAVLNTAQIVGTTDTGLLPRGRTTHALINLTYALAPNVLWDQAIVLAELGFTHLNAITANANNFNIGSGCTVPATNQVERGCLSTNNTQALLAFRPSWGGVAPGLDMGAAAAVVWGVKGNSPIIFGGNQGAGQYSIGLSATYNSRHEFALSYNDYFGTLKVVTTPAVARISNGLQANLQDRGWLSFTYKTSF